MIELNLGLEDNERWTAINQYLLKEQDRIYSSITHIKLAFGAVAIVAILLSFHVLMTPHVELRGGGYEAREFIQIYYGSLAFTVALVLIFVLAALYRVYMSFKKYTLKELKSKADAISKAQKQFEEEIPESTQKIIEGIKLL
ncbi:MAG: hypothetical protein AB2689_05200 [Candidatus Thiodiazotropha taylori]